MTSRDLTRKWVVQPEDRVRTAELARGLNVPRLIAHLLILRGVKSVEEGRRFLSPSLDGLSDPLQLTDTAVAVDRIRAALRDRERILIFGDYDVDGISGTAVLVRALRRLGHEALEYGLPNRLTEGYGLAPEHVQSAHERGVRLIITVDNGIGAHDAAARARQLGIDLIVTDHHVPNDNLPEALAILNPKREMAEHPAWDASGAAVAFKLASVLTGDIADLDLVALGLVADIVPLRGENRDLVAAGLAVLSKTARPGLQKLAEVASLRLSEVTAGKIAFQLGPRINAGGRLGDGLAGLSLLLTESSEEAGRLAQSLNEANEERRSIEQTIFDQAVEEIERTGPSGHGSFVLAKEGWHSGIIGIVAARLVDKYYRPTVLIAVGEDGVGRGSARSVEGFDLVVALEPCRDLLVRFGGHKSAAGLTIQRENVEAFTAAFEEEAAKRLPVEGLQPVVNTDALVALSEIDSRLVALLERLQPCGYGNPSPLFCTCGVQAMPNSYRELRGGHIRFTAKEGARIFPAVGFGLAEKATPELLAGPVDILFSPRFSTWHGDTMIELVVKDMRSSSE
ncbi:MAG: single-stranded-DNA-specific exonuclease RecJ [Candidatus Hydrogenedentes bacterium]|nr:single-stranded-DNA-specific exonuclease RecJ [Candidatus Hydrogenedentota bacterium]